MRTRDTFPNNSNHNVQDTRETQVTFHFGSYLSGLVTFLISKPHRNSSSKSAAVHGRAAQVRRELSGPQCIESFHESGVCKSCGEIRNLLLHCHLCRKSATRHQAVGESHQTLMIRRFRNSTAWDVAVRDFRYNLAFRPAWDREEDLLEPAEFAAKWADRWFDFELETCRSLLKRKFRSNWSCRRSTSASLASLAASQSRTRFCGMPSTSALRPMSCRSVWITRTHSLTNTLVFRTNRSGRATAL